MATLELGYAISVHSAQGSQYKACIVALDMSSYTLLSSNLIYTAITRAKKRLIIIGEPRAFMYGIRNNNEIVRKTNLLERLLNNLNKN